MGLLRVTVHIEKPTLATVHEPHALIVQGPVQHGNSSFSLTTDISSGPENSLVPDEWYVQMVRFQYWW